MSKWKIVQNFFKGALIAAGAMYFLDFFVQMGKAKELIAIACYGILWVLRKYMGCMAVQK